MDEEIEVRRSARRRRTVSAHREDGRIVVLLPASMSRHEETVWVRRMVERLRAREAKSRGPRGDDELFARALALQQKWIAPQLDDGLRTPSSVTWVSNQSRRWGSCTTSTGAIRLSDRLLPMPSWVVDYVLLHELTHLVEPDHSARFWKLLDAYPETARAKGYLEGWTDAVSHGARAPVDGPEDNGPEDDGPGEADRPAT